MCTVRGADIISPHGIPVDLLDRLLIIRTEPYSVEEMAQVIALRAKTEGIEIEADALVTLSQIGERATLR